MGIRDSVEGELVPALNEVGEGFEKKTVFLPQLLMSAEAAGAAFEAVRGRIAATGGQAGKGTVVVATVQGDIHDIGKNIARALLENYGYTVVDLGKDVPPEAVVEAARKSGAPLVGLSALMTTTVESMERTIRPVSYTHLDVYKRQACARASPRPETSRRRARRAVCFR